MRVANDGGHSRLRPWVAAVFLVMLAGCGSDPAPAEPPPAADVPAATERPSAEASRPAPPSPAPPPGDVPDPVAVAVPSLDIEASLAPLAVDKDNVLAPPDYGEAGWWQAGPEPGEPGAAVIAGHLDNADGPDVFYRLAQAEPGDEVSVTLADGSALTFTVVDVGQYSQDRFPTEQVYGADGDRRLLRLITCGGEYDRELGRYRDNVVVFAEQA